MDQLSYHAGMLVSAGGAAALSLFSPAGRRWPEGPDEGDGELRARGTDPLIASHPLGTSPRWGEEGLRTMTSTESIDSFHRGRFHVVQPLGQGHRSGMDAMLLASLVADERPIRVADLGAGAGAAGMAVASRLDNATVTLVERSPTMAAFARRSLELPENARFSSHVDVIEADVSWKGRERVAAGLGDDSFDHVIMNPPFNDSSDRRTPDPLKAEAHAMEEGLFETWIRTAGAIMRPGGQLSLIARPESIAEIIAASGRRFGGLEITALHPRPGENAVRILVTAIKQSRARIAFRAPLIMHEDDAHRFTAYVDDLNNGRATYARKTVSARR